MKSTLGVLALVLWGLTVAAAGFMFVKGTTAPAGDGRTSVLLAAAERDFVLAEMRAMLEAAQQVTEGLAENDLLKVAKAARAAGNAAVHQVPMSLMAKLPLDFKMAGKAMHQGYDELADAAEFGDSPAKLTAQLAIQMSRCVACHQAWRFDPK